MFWISCMLALSVLAELLVCSRWLVPDAVRSAVAVSGSLAGIVAATGLVVAFPGFTSAAIAFVTVYSCFNMTRLLARQTDARYLMLSAGRTAIWLATARVALLYGFVSAWLWQWPAVGFLVALTVIQLGTAILLVLSSRRQLRTTVLDGQKLTIDEKRLPSVTVAVPARNEASRLEACLTSVLSSNYPKLEILALDDGSQDRTAEVIKSFAHAGVRFIDGTELRAAGGLSKNRAYAALAQAASGDYILFCGSDIRLEPDTVRQLVAAMTVKHKTVLTVVPRNTSVQKLPFVQAMRYMWEMAPPRRLFRRPPVLSSCWMIDRRELEAAGGFAAVRHSVTPEAHFAYHAMSAADGYSFVRSNAKLGITSDKSLADQRQTAVYNRYLQLHRRPEMVMLLTAAELLLLLGPLLVVLAGLLTHPPLFIMLIGGLALAAEIYVFGTIQRHIFVRLSPARAYLGYFGTVISDVYYLNYSMYRYEFSAEVRDKNSKS